MASGSEKYAGYNSGRKSGTSPAKKRGSTRKVTPSKRPKGELAIF